MLDISKYLDKTQGFEVKRPLISLCGKLEGIIGNYFVRGAGVIENGCLQRVYYDADIDTFTEAVEIIPENLVAYVDSGDSWAFVLESHLKKFQEDTEEYHLRCISVSSFGEEILRCTNPAVLPEEFADILWVDDDFMNDENIPFDYKAFEIIDSEQPYLNPGHFSVNQLYEVIS